MGCQDTTRQCAQPGVLLKEGPTFHSPLQCRPRHHTQMLARECREVAALRVVHLAGALDGAGGGGASSLRGGGISSSAAGAEHDGHRASGAASKAAARASIISRTVLVLDIPGTRRGTVLSAVRGLLWRNRCACIWSAARVASV